MLQPMVIRDGEPEKYRTPYRQELVGLYNNIAEEVRAKTIPVCHKK